MKLFKKLFPILLILFISIFIIFFKFSLIPDRLAFDEVEFAKLALSLKDSPYTVYSPLATGHSTLYFYIILASFLMFGVGEFALRLPSAMFGVLSVLVFYKLMRGLFINIDLLSFKGISLRHSADRDDRLIRISLAFIVTLLLVSMRWYFNFARFAFEPTFLLFLELLSLYFAFQFVKLDTKKPLVLSGIFAGLAFHSYTPGRIFFIVPLLVILLFAKKKISSVLFFGIACFLVMLPLLFYLGSHQDIRVDQQSYLSNTELSVQDKAEFFGANLVNNIKMLYIPEAGDGNGRHNYPFKPAFNPFLFTLFILGLIRALTRPKNKIHLVFLLYLIVAFIPTLLTYPWENPNMLRTYTMLPSLVYFIGVGVWSLTEAIKKYIKKPVLQTVAISVLLLLIIGSSIYELRTYFFYQARDVIPHAFDVKNDLSILK